MAKEETGKPETQTLALSIDQIQQLIAGSIKTAIEESRKEPAEVIARKKKAKAEFQAVLQQGKDHQAFVQRNCTHIHPHAGRTTFQKAELTHPFGGWMLLCSRCFKVITNFDEKNTLIHNPEFIEWASKPSLVDISGNWGA
jgi:hypothetical protein